MFGKSSGGGGGAGGGGNGGGAGGLSSSIMPGAARDSIEAAEAFRQEFGKVQRDFRASLELQGKLLAKVCRCGCAMGSWGRRLVKEVGVGVGGPVGACVLCCVVLHRCTGSHTVSLPGPRVSHRVQIKEVKSELVDKSAWGKAPLWSCCRVPWCNVPVPDPVAWLWLCTPSSLPGPSSSRQPPSCSSCTKRN